MPYFKYKKNIQNFLLKCTIFQVEQFILILGQKLGTKDQMVDTLTKLCVKDLNLLDNLVKNWHSTRTIETIPVVLPRAKAVVFIRAAKFNYICLNDLFEVQCRGLKKTSMGDWLKSVKFRKYLREIAAILQINRRNLIFETRGAIFVKLCIALKAASYRGKTLLDPLIKKLRKCYPDACFVMKVNNYQLVSHTLYKTELQKIKYYKAFERLLKKERAENFELKNSFFFKFKSWLRSVFF